MGLGKSGLESGGGGPASSLAPNATGTTLVLSGSSTALQFIATQTAGGDAFLVNNNGARFHFGAGALDYASSDGTTVTFAGPVTTAAATVDSLVSVASIRSNNSQIYGAATGAGMDVVGFITSAAASATVAAVAVWPLNALDATDLVFRVGNASNAAPLLSVNYTGTLTLADQVVYSSFTDDSATTGNRTVNKVRGISAFAAAASAITITNSFVTATSCVFCVLQTNDGTALIKNVVPGAGSFVITLNAAATGTTKVGWVVMN